MPSAVRSKIASFEAQSSQASPYGGSPLVTNRPRTSIAAKKKRDALREQQKQQQDAELRLPGQQQAEPRSREPPHRSQSSALSHRDKNVNGINTNIKNKNRAISEPNASTTVTASENRKSRIRHSQQQIRENLTLPTKRGHFSSVFISACGKEAKAWRRLLKF